ncbi:FMN-dependent NADH-azoreductase [Pseudomonas chlororaphis]|uniref:FMN dependent NADH:quinone oxidoreductase n=1 Tax=Pseudomonas chlororaphis TaxID=587753 RepID=A0A1Q8ETX9_9PSED|nr:NAD(P)H-dependent oxidoreductase [Pseudomonas chlororaphis]OLF55256.1 FMN-dependent NADH-azoreductase [Pseudomonas chlororaphis]
MTRLLHIQCSPRKERSASQQVARGFIDRYLALHPRCEVSTLDLWSLDLPEFDQHAMDAKYAGLQGIALSPAQQDAWRTLEALAAPLHDADLLVLSVPLWNYSIPYKLKHFIDLVSQKDLLFSFSAEHGLRGLLQNKSAVVAYARGLDFSPQSDTPAQRYDFQKPYVEAWLGFVGVKNVHALIVEKTILGYEVDQRARQEAVNQARELADRLE